MQVNSNQTQSNVGPDDSQPTLKVTLFSRAMQVNSNQTQSNMDHISFGYYYN